MCYWLDLFLNVAHGPRIMYIQLEKKENTIRYIFEKF